MKRTFALVFAVVVSLLPTLLYGGYGDLVNGYPSQQERDLHLATNMVRIAPQEFRDSYIGSYNILRPEHYPPVDPIYLHYDLNRSGRVHAEDMAANCGLSHTSCNGTSWFTRIGSYYTDSGGMAENVASGYSTGLATVIQFLRDDVAGTPAADNSNDDGHRQNIMSSLYEDFGPGYAYSSTRQWYHFWVQDFGGGSPPFRAIAAGSHLYLSSQKNTFMAVFHDPDGLAPQKAQVVINGIPHTLNHQLGSTAKGSYMLELANDNDCRDYYFFFVDGGGRTWRFPETTDLSNNPSQTCYMTMELADAIRVLKVAAGSVLSGADSARIIDQNEDTRIGLADAVIILRQVAGL